ncbi:hypothetical protein AB0M47_26695 [Hamadaea sp. NPDC051192]|uniref:hypothetical protein n=1 Tax=Hamadaea sp. NPDC051192 TaxID=3154940 RepID=UPI00342EC2CD
MTVTQGKPKAGNLFSRLATAPGVLAAGAVLVGLTLFCCTDGLAGNGLVVVTVAIGVLGFLFGLTGVGAVARDRGRAFAVAVGVPLALLLGAAAAGTVAGLVSSGVHFLNEYDYGKAYGQPVQATIHDDADCSYFKSLRTEDSDITCENVTWQVDGTTQTGSLMVRLQNMEDAHAGRTLPAHLLDGTAYADGDGKVRPETFFGLVPWWLVLVSPIVALLCFGALASLGGPEPKPTPEPAADEPAAPAPAAD